MGTQTRRVRTPRSVADDIRGRSALHLRELIMRRPDLVSPMPADLTELAAKVTGPTSVRMAIDNLDSVQLGLLRYLSVNSQGDAMTPGTPIVELAQQRGVDVARLEELWELGLLWGAEPILSSLEAGGAKGSTLHIVGPVRAILVEAFGSADASEAGSSDVGQPESARTSGATSDVTADAGAAANSGMADFARVSPTGGQHSGTQIAMHAVTMVDDVALWVQATNPPQRKRGGIGIRDLTALANQAGTQDQELTLEEASFWIELMAHAGFIGVSRRNPLSLEYDVALTPNFDSWASLESAHQWAQLVSSWSTFDSAADLVNSESAEGERINALSGRAKRPVAPSVRRVVVRALSECEAGQALSDRQLGEAVEYRFPRLDVATRGAATAQAVKEGSHLGVMVRDGQGIHLTELGGAWVGSLVGGAATELVEAVAELFPAAVDQLIAQADMTLVVPGPPAPALRSLLGRIALRESTGGASVYRLTPATLRAAVAVGIDPDEILSELEAKSLTPIPQPMRYLIADAAQSASSDEDVEEPIARPRAERSLEGYSRAVGLGVVGNLQSGNSGGAFGVPLSADHAEFLADILWRTRPAQAGTTGSTGSNTAQSPQPLQPILATDPKETADVLGASIQSRAPVAICHVDQAGTELRLIAEVVSVQSGSVTVFDTEERKVKVLRRSRIAGVATSTQEAKGATND